MYSDLTQDQLKQALHYDPETGVFVWRRKPCKNREAGSLAGNTQNTGYRVIRVNGTLYKAHRLAWLYVHGCWPSQYIDHINGQKADNRIENLREATHAENMENRLRAHANNKLGVLGVTKEKGRFVARIRVSGRLLHVGAYATAEAAGSAYISAKRSLHSACTI